MGGFRAAADGVEIGSDEGAGLDDDAGTVVFVVGLGRAAGEDVLAEDRTGGEPGPSDAKARSVETVMLLEPEMIVRCPEQALAISAIARTEPARRPRARGDAACRGVNFAMNLANGNRFCVEGSKYTERAR